MLKQLKKDFKNKEISFSEKDYMITMLIKQKDLKEILKSLKNQQFNVLTDLSAIDYPERTERFEMIYNLLNIYDNKRIILKFSVADKKPVESIADIFSASVWYEREVWDMFGIHFNNSPDLRRILTDYDFEGHPLRKDFPLTGFQEVHYDKKQEKVVYAPVELPQEFRSFDFMSPWEGAKYILPGDEKVEKK
ncbi:MAG: NADH-quinone oxidoreductase subunit C [Rickettsiales bacterium]|jgi:NADH-quinone oxidoreductase subunit C|nr:NADH-quinone oxidoreductase subunit C [Rickettsiales bacterium]